MKFKSPYTKLFLSTGSLKQLAIIFFTVILAACGGGNESASTLDKELREIIKKRGLTGDPLKNRNIPDIQSPLAQLGKKIFFAKSLSGENDTACASCHHPLLGSGDGLTLPIGVHATSPDLLGTGRAHSSIAQGFDGGPTVPRNAQPIFNLAVYDSVLFWDGRIESIGKTPFAQGIDRLGVMTPDVPYGTNDVMAGEGLAEAQAGFPVTSPEEMRGFNFAVGQTTDQLHDRLAQRIGNYGPGFNELPYNDWLKEFQLGFNSTQTAEELITFQNIRKAIATYERSQAFVETPWNAYIKGNNSIIDDSAKRGAKLFFTSIDDQGAGCYACHTGDTFTDEKFHNICTVQVGRGKGDGFTFDDDFGRFNITGNEKDKYAFRTPNLLNVEVTGPWGHSGAYNSLESIVRYHLNPEAELSNFNFLQLDSGTQTSNAVTNTNAALLQREAVDMQTGVINTRTQLSNDQINDLVSFLKTLTDPCVKDVSCLSPWIPSLTETDPDGTRLNAEIRFY